jgi:Trk-type K+ transport system membrane component
MAFLLGIAPQILTVPAIMVGNTVYVVLLAVLADPSGKNLLRQGLAWLSAAVAKFAVLYAIVAWLICGVLSERLLASGVMKPPMLKLLPVTFGWPQLVTALIGGGIALVIAGVIRKALRK